MFIYWKILSWLSLVIFTCGVVYSIVRRTGENGEGEAAQKMPCDFLGWWGRRKSQEKCIFCDAALCLMHFKLDFWALLFLSGRVLHFCKTKAGIKNTVLDKGNDHDSLNNA